MVWNKGLIGIKTSNKGQIPWNKGLKDVYSKDILEKMRMSTIGKKHPLAQGNLNPAKRIEVRVKIGKANTGKIRSIEVRRKNSQSHIGRIISEKTKIIMSKAQKKRFENPVERSKRTGENNGFYGHKHDLKTIEIMKQKLSILLSGPNNPQWLGGLSYESYGKEFNDELKDQIRERDGFKCQVCNILQFDLGYKLIVHHKDYDKRNNLSSNLISLCRNCHMETNFNRENWKSLFQSKEVQIL